MIIKKYTSITKNKMFFGVQATYEKAMSRGKGGGLIQSNSKDSLRLDVGRIGYLSTATAVITLCMETLPEGNFGRRIELPTLVDTARYPSAPLGNEVNEVFVFFRNILRSNQNALFRLTFVIYVCMCVFSSTLIKMVLV
jgi:hypothetical protein